MRYFITQHRTPAVLLLLSVACFCAPVLKAHGCDTGTVRDMAFYSARDSYWLGMVFDPSDEESNARFNELSHWLEEQGASLNMHAEHVLPEDAMYLRLRYGVTTAPTELPVTYLAGRHPGAARPVVFMEWTPAPDTAFLEGLKNNPLFERIARDTPEYWATILYARGVGKEHRSDITAVRDKWAAEHSPGISIIELDRHASENAFLCTIAGIEEDGDDWTGIVFGSGKLMTPILVGDAISFRELDRLLNRLTVPCTCLQQAAVFGIDLPMFWEEAHTERHIELAAPLGYMEMSLDDKLASVLTEISDGAQPLNIVVPITLALLGGGALALVAFHWLRWRRQ